MQEGKTSLEGAARTRLGPGSCHKALHGLAHGSGPVRCLEQQREEATSGGEQQVRHMTHLGLLHRVFQVVVNPGDEVGVEACQGKESGGCGRCAKWVNVPGELRPDPKCFIEKSVSLCKESITLLGLVR